MNQMIAGVQSIFETMLLMGGLVLSGGPFLTPTFRYAETARPYRELDQALFAALNRPACTEIPEDGKITLKCDYPSTTIANDSEATRILINHAFFSFETRDENYMQVELTFTNTGTEPVAEARDVYLEIDDDTRQNYVRRVLPSVDLRKLVLKRSLTFSSRILIGTFRPNHYTIYLWIPSSDPPLKFKHEHNLLLCNSGVADPVTGLNKIAEFTVQLSGSTVRTSR
jgi:Domain of unknown function (DUF4832)